MGGFRCPEGPPGRVRRHYCSRAGAGARIASLRIELAMAQRDERRVT